jgi:hypothetical protein
VFEPFHTLGYDYIVEVGDVDFVVENIVAALNLEQLDCNQRIFETRHNAGWAFAVLEMLQPNVAFVANLHCLLFSSVD